jgi:hypothetical protein
MVSQIMRRLLLIGIVSLLPFAGVPPVAAAHSDECAGGVDAGNRLSEATLLAIEKGCTGNLYKPPEGSNHTTDTFDAYWLYGPDPKGFERVRIDFQICNLGTDGFVYGVWYYNEYFGFDRYRAGGLNGGECSHEEPQLVVGGYRPGYWVITIETFGPALPPNSKIPYYLYAGSAV